MTVFGIPITGPGARDVRVEHELGHASLLVDGDTFLVIEHQLLPSDPFDASRFSVFPCYSHFTLAHQITELRIHNDGKRKTFGYVFPITSFRNEIGFEKKYGLIYADAAFRKFLTVENIKRYQTNYTIDIAELNRVPLDAVVNDSLSILAISKEFIDSLSITNDILDLMLRRAEIEVSFENKNGPSFVCTTEYEPGLNLRKPKISDQDDISRISMLLKNADEDNSEIGKFIQYYQFFEYMILKIFEWGIPHVANSGVSPWEMRDLLNDLGGERKRLSRLAAHCVPDLDDRKNQSLLADACRDFLDAVEIDHENKEAWHSVLYLVRNSVVHNQFRLLSPEYMKSLILVNKRLRAVSLDYFFNFQEPDRDSFFA